VADEVRALADGRQRPPEISTMISMVQKETKDAVKFMNQGVLEVEMRSLFLIPVRQSSQSDGKVPCCVQLGQQGMCLGKTSGIGYLAKADHGTTKRSDLYLKLLGKR